MEGVTSFLKLNTKQDFINNRAELEKRGDTDPLQDYRRLYENRFNWFNMLDGEGNPITVAAIETVDENGNKLLAPSEDAIIDDEHKVVYDEQANIFLQQELRVDPNGLYALKGFTVEELEEILGL